MVWPGHFATRVGSTFAECMMDSYMDCGAVLYHWLLQEKHGLSDEAIAAADQPFWLQGCLEYANPQSVEAHHMLCLCL